MKNATRVSAWRDCALVERLRAARFDAAAIFTSYSQSPLPAALMCHLAGIDRVLAHCRENPYGLISDWVREPELELPTRHEVQRQLDLVATVGATTSDTGLALTVPPTATAGALRALRAAGIDPDEPWLLLHPGATAASRRYPPEHYVEALRQLARETGRRVAISGSDAERREADEIVAGLGDVAASLAGELSFAELCGLVSAAPLLICGNTGPAHIAAAVGTPSVVAYALTNPQHTPWQAPGHVLTHDVACRWCLSSVCREGHHHCLRLIPPLELAEAALDVLGRDVSPAIGGAPLAAAAPLVAQRS
jgi:ADP-heptose:LPS heptosyltransferase